MLPRQTIFFLHFYVGDINHNMKQFLLIPIDLTNGAIRSLCMRCYLHRNITNKAALPILSVTVIKADFTDNLTDIELPDDQIFRYAQNAKFSNKHDRG